MAEAFGKARLDHVDAVFGQLVDGGEVFLDRRVELLSHPVMVPGYLPLGGPTPRHTGEAARYGLMDYGLMD